MKNRPAALFPSGYEPDTVTVRVRLDTRNKEYQDRGLGTETTKH